MLLLVLILILIAFGLLVVALLSGSVLWAWVSVAVSAVAALVLVVDALQRRSAVRAGATADAGPPAPERSLPEADRFEPEPVTEILPVIPPAAAAPPAEAAPGGVGGSGSDSAAGFRPGREGQRTVAVGRVQPPGSEERPSGAGAGAAPPSRTSSPSVTESGVEAGTTKVGATGGGTVPPAGDPGGSEATVAVRSRGTGPNAGIGSNERPIELGKPPAGAGSSTGPGADRQPPERPADRTAGPPSDLPGHDPVKPSDPTVVGSPPADLTAASAEPADIPAAADVEPPEEPRDPTVAAIVAVLPDEVVVVDEQPRYHLGTCRALTARSVIPLPVREAVDLGFTPCGWCTPDRTLAERHPARAQ